MLAATKMPEVDMDQMDTALIRLSCFHPVAATRLWWPKHWGQHNISAPRCTGMSGSNADVMSLSIGSEGRPLAPDVLVRKVLTDMLATIRDTPSGDREGEQRLWRSRGRRSFPTFGERVARESIDGLIQFLMEKDKTATR
jgi:hypothetical protein